MENTSQKIQSKKKELELLKHKVHLQENLPHLYGWRWYDWAWEFFESTNHTNLLCAANQISKSSTQIRKCIEWATNLNKWSSLWNHKPLQFWYLYPSRPVAKAEWETKWSQFMPKGEYKNDNGEAMDGYNFGWKADFSAKEGIKAIYFNSGVTVYFKTYAQNVADLQSGTVDALFCDEELPEDLYDELLFRLSASDGYFHMVFTATLGQDFWRRALEPRTDEDEVLADAWKKQVSMYECMKYMDGTRSHWTEEKIQKVRNKCKSHQEVLRRVFGKFVKDSGLKYPQFDSTRHLKKYHMIPKNWVVYAGADTGSGGQKGHPSALCYVAVDPTYRQGRVFLGWRGDGITTTASDVVKKHIELKKEHNLHGRIIEQNYDWGDADFANIAVSMKEPFTKAEKSHEKGESVINTLFKNDMLAIYETEELGKLAGELSSLLVSTPKKKAKDDFIDALRYAIVRVPWDWSVITGDRPDGEKDPEPQMTAEEFEKSERRRQVLGDPDKEEALRIEEEFDEWNAIYEG